MAEESKRRKNEEADPVRPAPRIGKERGSGSPAHQNTEVLFRLLVASVADYAIFLLDAEGRITSWNKGAANIKGYAADEIIGQHFSKFYTPEDIARNHPSEELKIARQEGSYE